VTCHSSRPSVYELLSCKALTDRHIRLLVKWYGDLSLTIICHFLSDNKIIATRKHSDVGIATRYGMNGLGFYSRLEKERFTSPKSYRPALGPTPAFCLMGIGVFLGVKRPGREADHTPPLVPMLGVCTDTSLPPPALYALTVRTDTNLSSRVTQLIHDNTVEHLDVMSLVNLRKSPF